MLMCRSKLLRENLQLVLIYCALISAGRMRQERVVSRERERDRERQVKRVREVARGRQLVEEEDS